MTELVIKMQSIRNVLPQPSLRDGVQPHEAETSRTAMHSHARQLFQQTRAQTIVQPFSKMIRQTHKVKGDNIPKPLLCRVLANSSGGNGRA